MFDAVPDNPADLLEIPASLYGALSIWESLDALRTHQASGFGPSIPVPLDVAQVSVRAAARGYSGESLDSLFEQVDWFEREYLRIRYDRISRESASKTRAQ